MGRGKSGKTKLSSATSSQKSTMERLSSRLAVGDYNGAGKYGGGGKNIVITKPVEYRMNKDGSISYIVTGERLTRPLKSETIGVGDEPAKMRPVTVIGKIEKGGKLFLPDGAVQKGEEKVVATTWNQYRKWFKERYGREP